MEEALSGGNTSERIVRIGETVRRPTGGWTPGVHALLRHLEQQGYEGAPRVLGTDEQGREVLDYVEGDVVHPDHDELLASDSALAEVAVLIRRFHDAAQSFEDPTRAAAEIQVGRRRSSATTTWRHGIWSTEAVSAGSLSTGISRHRAAVRGISHGRW